MPNALPPITASTSPLGYVRFHGRNNSMWNARTASAADRFDYLYSPEELEEWSPPIHHLAEETERTWVMFNNCRYDYAPRNAREMAEILGDVVAPRLSGVGETGEPSPNAERSGATSRSEEPDSADDIGSTGTLF
jgi:uncharacterized protein YecE (DUF72 family)